MSDIDIERRNAVIRKYLPGLLRAGNPERWLIAQSWRDIEHRQRHGGRNPRFYKLKWRLRMWRVARKQAVLVQGATPKPTFSLEEFFTGCGDEHSIAPNLQHHPGMQRFRDTLFAIRSRPEVVEIRITPHEWPDPLEPKDDGEWLHAGAVIIWTHRAVPQAEVAEWVSALRPDSVDASAGAFALYGAPLADQCEGFIVCWD